MTEELGSSSFAPFSIFIKQTLVVPGKAELGRGVTPLLPKQNAMGRQ